MASKYGDGQWWEGPIPLAISYMPVDDGQPGEFVITVPSMPSLSVFHENLQEGLDMLKEILNDAAREARAYLDGEVGTS